MLPRHPAPELRPMTMPWSVIVLSVARSLLTEPDPNGGHHRFPHLATVEACPPRRAVRRWLLPAYDMLGLNLHHFTAS